MELISDVLIKNGLLFAFVIVGAMMWISYYASHHLTRGRLHGSAVAIILGLVLAYFGGLATGGKKGLADIELFAGLGIMGGAMLRDFAIVSTAYGVDLGLIRRAGITGVVSLFLGIVISFIVGGVIALIAILISGWIRTLITSRHEHATA